MKGKYNALFIHARHDNASLYKTASMNVSPPHALPQERALGCFPIGRANGANPREPADKRAARRYASTPRAGCWSRSALYIDWRALPRGCWQLLRAMLRLLQGVNFVVHLI